MPLVVVGSVALDSVETPAHGKRDDVLGGSAVFFSYTASFFTSVRLAGVIGEDWPPQHLKMLQERGIDTAGLQVIPGGKTFRWSGRYLTEHERPRDAQPEPERHGPVRPRPARALSQVQVPLPRQRGHGDPDAGHRSMPRRATGRGRHDGPLDPQRPRERARRCSSGSTGWCSTTARPSC